MPEFPWRAICSAAVGALLVTSGLLTWAAPAEATPVTRFTACPTQAQFDHAVAKGGTIEYELACPTLTLSLIHI